MPLQARSAKTYTFDALTELSDGATSHTTSEAGEVAAAAVVHDFGNVSVQLVENVAYTGFDFVVDFTSFDSTTGDETGIVILQLSDNASGADTGFDASDTIVNRVAIPMGDIGGLALSTADDENGLGRVIVGCDNEHKGVVYRYARAFLEVGGTTPIIQYAAFMGEPLPA